MATSPAAIGGLRQRTRRRPAVPGSVLIAGLVLLAAAAATAGPTDIAFPPTTSAGHDFNHAPVGQSFRAIVPGVTAGIHIADGVTFTSWLATIYPGQIQPGSYPYTPASTLNVTVSLHEGEGMDGALLHSTSVVVQAPFMGFLDVDYAAAGVVLVPGSMYTIVVSDDGPAAYPQGVSGWVVSSVTDPVEGQPVTDARGAVVGYLPYGAYPEGHPILQGMLYASDAGIGDNAFHVVDADAALAPLAILTTALPAGRVGVAYAAPVESAGGVAPVTIEITGLPAGLGFDGAHITGTPEVPGTFGLMITAADSQGDSVATSSRLVIDPAPSSSMVKDEGKGRITGAGPGYIKVGAKTIKYDSTTILKLNYAPSIEVGMVAQWKGFRQPRTSVVLATKLEIR
jgi:hypothetical protein